MKSLGKRSKLFSSFLLVSLVALSGCQDMQYKNVQDYYDTFADTAYQLYTSDGKDTHKNSCSIEDSLYNSRTVNEIRSDDLLDYNNYEYLALQVCVDDFEFENIALFIRADEGEGITNQLHVNISIVDDMPEFIRGYAAPKTKIDEETKEEIPIIYDDMDLSFIASTVAICKESAWTDFLIEDFKIDGKAVDSVPVEKGQFILFQFRNNLGYGFDEGLTKISFSMINLMVSNYDPNGENSDGDDDDWDDTEDWDDPDDYDY